MTLSNAVLGSPVWSRGLTIMTFGCHVQGQGHTLHDSPAHCTAASCFSVTQAWREGGEGRGGGEVWTRCRRKRCCGGKLVVTLQPGLGPLPPSSLLTLGAVLTCLFPCTFASPFPCTVRWCAGVRVGGAAAAPPGGNTRPADPVIPV